MAITCHHCHTPITLAPGAYHVIGILLQPSPPANLYACATCWATRPHVLSGPERETLHKPAPEPEPADLAQLSLF